MEIYRNKMLITNEYIRRVISDVYVAVTNNIYYVERNLDDPDGHKEVMARIVKSGTRVRSCGISFIEDYYPEKGRLFCPFAWRNSVNLDEIYTIDMGDANQDYLTDDWFLDVVRSDSSQWSEPFYDGYGERTSLLAYEAPIHDQEGRVVAVLGADISLDWLTNKLSEADTTINKSVMVMASIFEMKSSSFLINHDGLYITSQEGNRILKDDFFTHLETGDAIAAEELKDKMVSAVGSEEGGMEKILFDGEECYLYYFPIKYTQWLLITLVPCRAVDILSQLNAATLLFIFLMAMLFIIFVGYYYIKNGIYPLKQLTKVANDIASGKLDTLVPEMEHSDEISQLRDSIEEMQYRLSSNADNVR
ncbi:MAG: HAMP domain-containing protein [Bacteroidaceae bacterium]|nr:HAMP domain-containing protein [Bacteroidaceae bacterium]